MFRHDYPYTDFHEMNLDWFLNKFNEVLAEWAQMQHDFTTLQEAFEDLRNFVINYFDNLDVTEEINAKLQNMFEQGLFDAMLSSVLKEQKGAYLALNKVMSIAETSDRYLESATASDYWYSQGATCDNNYIYIAYVSSIDDNNNSVTIRKYNINNFTYVTENSIAINHCNDMCIKDGKIYATSYGYGGATNNDLLAIIDAATLTLEETKHLGNNFTLITYDPDTDRFYTSNGSNIICYDTDFNFISSNPLEFPIGERSQARTGLNVINGYVYFATGFPNTLEKYDLGGHIISVYNFGYYNSDYPVGETEGLFYHNGNFYLTSSTYPGAWTPTVLTQMFIFNTNGGLSTGHSNFHYTYSSYQDIYVDRSYTGVLSDGSAAKPYREINEAITCSASKIGAIRIRAKAGDYQSISVLPMSKLHILRNGSGTVTIKGCNFSMAGFVRLQDVTINKPEAISNYNGNIITGYLCDLKMNNCVINFSDGCTRALNITYGDLFINNLTINGVFPSEPINLENGSGMLHGITTANGVSVRLVNANIERDLTLSINPAGGHNSYGIVHYMFDTPISEISDFVLPDWINNILDGHNYGYIILNFQFSGGSRCGFVVNYVANYCTGAWTDPNNENRLYCAALSLENKRLVKVGYTDLTDGGWVPTTEGLSFTGIDIVSR